MIQIDNIIFRLRRVYPDNSELSASKKDLALVLSKFDKTNYLLSGKFNLSDFTLQHRTALENTNKELTEYKMKWVISQKV